MQGLLTLVCAAGSGVMAGVFFVFSVAIMQALRALPPPSGIAAMQSINIVIVNPLFLSVFLGTGAACAAAAVVSVTGWDTSGGWGTLAGSAFYLIGAVLVTMGFNVPLNNALARVAPESGDGARVWADYLSRWTAWNHVRTLAALAAMLSFLLARWA